MKTTKILVTASGGRKTSSAVVCLFKGSGKITVNERSLEVYFPDSLVQEDLKRPFLISDTADKYDVKARVIGGGKKGQAEAVRLALSRALVKLDNDLRSKLREADLLTRDPRMKERKKYGFRGARRGVQWTKR
ncbi:MAG: 30S ribosomal protein S9 [Candidatus Omnitrophota bacterium]